MWVHDFSQKTDTLHQVQALFDKNKVYYKRRRTITKVFLKSEKNAHKLMKQTKLTF